ncbi:39S ribosomal protein L52, mitochondrial-like isoform X2 [Xenopus laevis]|uniref:Large ribosomal subunit protein mL52 n=2 Tax=Xenopus laevis TaxID=8355 RepID=A0A974I4M0_XENLA|nr:39S ribosomal protein L52, mitochondrial-like isoform X2 [Xenopus laevis]OCU01256.1 hypothetical protein XELAEV_18007046mg [Xenopus laevis]
MAAPIMSIRCTEQVTRLLCVRLWNSVDLSRAGNRNVHSSALRCAGQDWRVRRGFARSGSEYGPLTDLPDWSFADGRPAPPWKGQIRRKEEREAFAHRVVLLSTEMDQGMINWNNNRQKMKAEQLDKERSKLQSKASLNKTTNTQ